MVSINIRENKNSFSAKHINLKETFRRISQGVKEYRGKMTLFKISYLSPCGNNINQLQLHWRGGFICIGLGARFSLSPSDKIPDFFKISFSLFLR